MRKRYSIETYPPLKAGGHYGRSPDTRGNSPQCDFVNRGVIPIVYAALRSSAEELFLASTILYIFRIAFVAHLMGE